jgi:CDP-glucose 4,6-dehydratase
MGTVNLLEAIRLIDSINAVIVVSSDKCYENKEWVWGYREDERMGGFDPYSNSKGCAELITSAYVSSFFNKSETAVASARAGNVIGGGDWAKNRLVPDFFRALEKKETLVLRYPNAIRPWQHVLEPISGYVKLAESLIKDNKNFIGGWNFGPSDEDAKTVIWVIEFLSGFYSDFKWKIENQESVHEANYLKLDISKARMNLGWKPKWKTEIALTKTIEWYNALIEKRDMLKTTYQQIEDYTISKIGQLNCH